MEQAKKTCDRYLQVARQCMRLRFNDYSTVFVGLLVSKVLQEEKRSKSTCAIWPRVSGSSFLSVLLCFCMTRRYDFPFHFSTGERVQLKLDAIDFERLSARQGNHEIVDRRAPIGTDIKCLQWTTSTIPAISSEHGSQSIWARATCTPDASSRLKILSKVSIWLKRTLVLPSLFILPAVLKS